MKSTTTYPMATLGTRTMTDFRPSSMDQRDKRHYSAMGNSTRILLNSKPGQKKKCRNYKKDVAIWAIPTNRDKTKSKSKAVVHRKLAIGGTKKASNFLNSLK